MNSRVSCETFEEGVWLYLDDDLSPDERARWDNHLEGCERCRETLSNSQSTVGLYDRHGKVDAPEALIREVVSSAAMADTPRTPTLAVVTRMWRPVLAAAAAFTLMLYQPDLIGHKISEHRPIPPRGGYHSIARLLADPQAYLEKERSPLIPGLESPARSRWRAPRKPDRDTNYLRRFR